MAGSPAHGPAWLEAAAETHRRAAALADTAGAVLDGYAPRPRSAVEERGIRELAERLRVAAALLAPGWLGAPLDAVPASTPLGVATRPEAVRIGTAYPLDDASFPALVPLGHLALDGDARDPRVAGVLRAVLLRLLATARAGSLRVRAVDPAGDTFAQFAPLHDTGILPAPVAGRAGLQEVLAEAERWVGAEGTSRKGTLVLVLAGWPQTTEAEDVARLSALAAAGPAGGVHLLVAGWPPPPLAGEPGAEPTGHPLPQATQVTLRNPYVLVGHPPGGSFGTLVPPGQPPATGLNAQVFLDAGPSVELTARVCGDLAGAAGRGGDP